LPVDLDGREGPSIVPFIGGTARAAVLWSAASLRAQAWLPRARRVRLWCYCALQC